MGDYTPTVIKLFPFGVRETRVKVNTTNLPWGAAQSVEAHEVLTTAELTGDDVIQAEHSFPVKAEGKLTMGGVSLQAYALVTGRTIATNGATPTRTGTLSVAKGDVFPYFTLYVRAVNDDGGDTWYVLYKCKLTDGMGGQFQYGQFRTTDISFSAIPDSANSDKIMDIVSHETAVSLPTS